MGSCLLSDALGLADVHTLACQVGRLQRLNLSGYVVSCEPPCCHMQDEEDLPVVAQPGSPEPNENNPFLAGLQQSGISMTGNLAAHVLLNCYLLHCVVHMHRPFNTAFQHSPQATAHRAFRHSLSTQPTKEGRLEDGPSSDS